MTDHTTHSKSGEDHPHHHSHTVHAQSSGSSLPWANIMLAISAAILLFTVGYKMGEAAQPSSAQQSVVEETTDRIKQSIFGNSGADFSLYWNVFNKVKDKFVDQPKLDDQKMYYGAIKGMVASLEDPYTFFLTPEENKKSKDDLGGKFEGIGAQLGLRDGGIVIIAPLKNSPAIRAGLRSGDYILKVNNEDTKGWTLQQTVAKIRGPKGTTVSLGILREAKELSIEIQRDTIKVESIELSRENKNGKGYAVLKVNQFGDETNREWDAAASSIEDDYQAGQIQGMVLDLRGTPGGYLESAVYLASEFIEPGNLIVKQESKTTGGQDYYVQRPGKLRQIPVITLIDGGSASAAEILAGALRDHERTTLVGEKSFGKGSVQEALDLPGNAGLHVTVAKWVLPDGDWINGKGLTPSVTVKNELKEGNTIERDTDTQMDSAVDELLKTMN